MAVDTTAPRTRRALLAGAFGGLAALAAQALRPLAARAEGEVIHVGDTIDTARTVTWLTNARNDNHVVKAESRGAGTGVYGVSDAGYGVHGRAGDGVDPSVTPTGVFGESSRGFGVFGIGRSANAGVYGTSRDGDGVRGSGPGGAGVSGRGRIGVRGEGSTGVYGSTIPGAGEPSVHGVKARFRTIETNPGNAVLGEVRLANSSSTAVVGETAGPGAGVRGTSAQGRGGLFQGPRAQVRLIPTTASHPATGAMGDLVADTDGRLWFCRGGADWKQLA